MNICVHVNNLSSTREPCPGVTGESGLHPQSFQTHQPHPMVLPHRGLLKKDGRLERTQSMPGTTQPPSLYQLLSGHSSEVKEWFLETQYCDTEKAANSSKSHRQDISWENNPKYFGHYQNPYMHVHRCRLTKGVPRCLRPKWHRLTCSAFTVTVCFHQHFNWCITGQSSEWVPGIEWVLGSSSKTKIQKTFIMCPPPCPHAQKSSTLPPSVLSNLNFFFSETSIK